MSDWKLLIEDDVGDTTSVPLLRGLLTIGRKEGNTVRLTARNVSRFHARLVREAEHLFVEDLDSYNGVKINGDRIKGRVEVKEGDLIEIGDYHLALHMEVATNPVGAKASAMSNLFPDNTDDAFAGETQRWEPSPSQLPTKDGAVPTGLDLLDTDETARMPFAPSSAELNTAEEQNPNEMPDPLMPGPSSLRSLAALGADEYETPAMGAPLLTLDPSAQDREQLPARSGNHGHAHIPPLTEPYFPAYAAPPTVGPKAASIPARVSLVDAPMAEPSGVPSSHAPSAPSAPSGSLQSVVPRAAVGSSVPDPLNAPPEAVSVPPAPTAALPSSQDAPATAEPAPAGDAEIASEATEAMPVAPHNEIDTSMPRLVALNTVLAGASFPIEGMDMVVGRVDGCELLIQHKSVSRSHCRLVREGNAVRVIDLKSANGTLVNGVELDQAVLRSGDVLELGTVLLRFVPVGDDFSLSTEEIIRAREAEAQGNEWQDDSTLTSLSYDGNVNLREGPIKWAAIVGLVMVVALLAFLVGRFSDSSSHSGTDDGTGSVETESSETE